MSGKKGIIFPRNWEGMIKREVVGRKLQVVTTGELEVELEIAMRKSLAEFGDKEFCLALSGGLDSSVLAVLLMEKKVEFTAITIAADRNHPDVIFAKKLAEKFKLDHKVCFLGHQRTSRDVYDDLFYVISNFSRCVICADAVDEMLGGYVIHRDASEEERKNVFENFWQRLIPEHLRPMNYYAAKHNVMVVLPYLAAYSFLRDIDMSQRVGGGQGKIGKIILRQLARKLGVPESIIDRRKYGLCSVWEKFLI